MRYLTVLTDLDYRGSQRVAQNYSIGMKHLGHDVKVLTLNALGPRAQELERADIQCSCLAADTAALDYMVGWKPDVVHVHRPGLFDPDFTRVLLRLRTATDPVIIETNFFSRVDYGLADGVIDVHLHLTKWCLWKWQQWSRVLNYRPMATIVPNSVISQSFFRAPAIEVAGQKQRMGIPQQDFVFVRIGASSEAKWHPMIVDAFAETHRRIDTVSLLLIAPPPSICAKVDALPENVRAKVFSVPKIDNDSLLRLLYSCGDVMLHAARIGESFGMVLVESLLCETPVITLSTPTRDNSQTEVVQHRRSGVVVNDGRAFVNAMMELVLNPLYTRALGQHGRALVVAQFENARVCSRLEILCNLLLTHHGSRTSNHTLEHKLSKAGFVTEVPKSYGYDILGQFDGGVSVSARLLSRLVHQPHLYKLYAYGILPLKRRFTG